MSEEQPTGTDRSQTVHDLAVPYAVDALDPAELAEFEAHLPSCPECQVLVADLQESAAGLSEGLEVAPPTRLRQNLLDAVAAEAVADETPVTDPAAPAGLRAVPETPVDGNPVVDRAMPTTPTTGSRSSRSGHRWWLAAAAAVVIGTGVWGASQLIETDPALRIVQADDAQRHTETLDQTEVVVITSASRDGAVLQLSGLSAPPTGQDYQAWFVDEDGSVRSAGLVGPEMLTGEELMLDGSPTGAVAVGITVEPAGGSEQPTSEPFLVVPLG